ncbi:hypothetical protein [Brasilonema bromeliae]|uniref:Uncharacterized protein n=1 Tax=Brasilonema bromeliae SPC951 TaxID=385972 RepID=A0ABX1P970_9CYAN|nr:hypothetical protein [Brasilonema bromeliae]NMG20982.1 hypothetical protein [Brasilonema bromeliae SPC951]
MPPKINNSVAWDQAELLMQPAFIRVIDNIRKLLDVSSWTGTYQDVLIWPTGTTDETKAIVTQFLQDLEAATPEQALEIREKLSRLPIPHPGYHLSLQRQEQTVNIDLWELCYRVCFSNYISGDDTADIDTDLIDENGDVDWQNLDNKAKELVEQVFANLPE